MDIVSYVEFLVQSICQDAQLVKVSSYESEEDGLILDVLIPESSMGAVIGVGGRNAKAIRTMVAAYAYLHKLGKVKVNMEAF